MKLYDSPLAPNPRRVRVFLAEKGISVPTEMVDLAKLEQKDPAFTALNPLQRIPILKLDSGEILSESVAICRYFEELQPDPPLFGRDSIEKARVEMWQRRAEWEFFLPIALAFRHSHPAMKEMEKPQIRRDSRAKSRSRHTFRAFSRFRVRETAFSGRRRPFRSRTLLQWSQRTSLGAARIAFPDNLAHFARWRAEVSARPSASA